MTTRSTLFVLLAGAGIAALTLSPAVAVGQDLSTSAVSLQDSAEQTSAPGDDDAAVTSEPGGGDDAAVTSEPGEDTEEDGEPGGGEEDWWELEGADDPSVWESLLTDEGFVGVVCSVQDVGDDAYQLTESAPVGKDWLAAVLLTETVFDILAEPYVGEQLWLEGEDGRPMMLSQVVLCAADLEAGEGDPSDLGGGLTDGGVEEGVGGGTGPVGPVVETDEPVSSPGAGLFLGLAAAGLAAGVLLAAGRRGPVRR